LDDLLHRRDLVLEESGELLRSLIDDFLSDGSELLLDLRIVKGLDQRRADLLKDFRRRAFRCHQSMPGDEREIGYGFRDRWQVREKRKALSRRDREGAHLAVFDERLAGRIGRAVEI